MKAVINVDQNAAMLAGENSWGGIVFDFNPADLSQNQRVELSKSSINKGAYSINFWIQPNAFRPALSEVAKVDIDAIKKLLDERIELRKKFEIEQREKDTEYLKDNFFNVEDDGLIALVSSSYRIPRYELTRDARTAFEIAIRLKDQKAIDRINRIKSELIPAKNAEAQLKAENDEKIAELERQQRKKKEVREAAQIAAWVAKHGTENQKGRFSEGLLDRAEILKSMGDQLFSALDDTMWDSETEYFDDYQEEKKESLSAEQYDRILYFREKFPGSKVKVEVIAYRYAVDDDYQYDDEYEYGIKYCVTITVGEFEFTRNFV